MDTLTNALLYPLTFDQFNCEDENVTLNQITAVKVLDEFEDDHVTSYKLEFTVNGKNYQYTDYWAGNESRMYYQSEISQDVRDSVLLPYLLEKLRDGQEL
jgi:hypothetical protein